MEFSKILAAAALNESDGALAIRSKIETADAHLVSLARDLNQELERGEKLKRRFDEIMNGKDTLITKLVLADRDATDLLTICALAEVVAKLIQARARLASRLRPISADA